MHTDAWPCRPAPISARLARAAAFSFCRVAAWMYRAAWAIERTNPPEAERQYAHMLLSSYGKLD